ncbi:cadmium-translocating P-type ATPase [Bacillus sp. RG28]|uniref:Cadmium-translocating P-type ATPase n=1 Tax=Gottfriedia endophytica TaxID=2820819 RepID=A0A940NPK3_9BACI|nr:cadmium-translocating P-type ATPase [Gottfriedia endophytica]
MGAQSQSQVKREFLLEGLDCSNCAMKIENRVKRVDGISTCSVNFATKTMTLTTDSKNEESVIENASQTVKKLEPKIHIIDKNKPNDHVHSHDHQQNETKKIVLQLGTSGLLLLLSIFGSFGESISIGLFIIAYLIAGYEVVMKAIRNIFRGQVFDENFLMALATVGAFLIGQYPEAVSVMLFYQLGELFQSIAVNKSRKSITDLMDIRPEFANVKVDGQVKQVQPEEVSIGEIILVKPGEKVPLDGILIAGNSSLDTSALTGESIPREVNVGDEILSGMINKQGVIEVKVTKRYNESTVSKIIELVQNASNRKANTENFITKFARIYTPIVVISALLVAVIPPLLLSGATFHEWIYRALIFLVISCPCALVVSIPLGFFGGIGAASRNGILVKGSNFLEALNDLQTIVFDKTGTLTKGEFNVVSIHPSSSYSEEELLKTAAYAEKLSNHPIAQSIVKQFDDNIDDNILHEYEEIVGHGISVKLNTEHVLAGNEKLMNKFKIPFIQTTEVGTVVHIAKENDYLGYLVIADELKVDSQKAIKSLKQLGIQKTVMLTGDANKVATSIANKLQLDETYAELLPHQKVEKFEEIEKMNSNHAKIAFVGDGMNDAPVLARADVGIAMGGLGSDAAIEAADIVIMTDEPSKIADAIKIAKSTRRIVWQNICFALLVKGFFLLLGLFGIATMWEAVISDVGVTVLAVLNAMRILRVKIV